MFTYFRSMAALLTGCLFLLSSCENSVEEVNALFSNKAAVEEAEQVSSYLSQDGKMKAHLTAPYMLRQVTDSNYIEFPRTLHVDFFNDSSVIETILDAKYAKYREYESKVLLRDSVRVINIKNGDTLRTPELWWDQNKQEFYTDKPSHISKRDGTVIFSKNGMKAKQDLGWYELYGNSGQLPVPDEANPNADSTATGTPGNADAVPPAAPQPAPVVKPPTQTAPSIVPGNNIPSGKRRSDSLRQLKLKRMQSGESDPNIREM